MRPPACVADSRRCDAPQIMTIPGGTCFQEKTGNAAFVSKGGVPVLTGLPVNT